MSGRIHPLLLVLLVIAVAAAVYAFSPWRDRGGGVHGGGGDGADGPAGRAVGLEALRVELLALPYQEDWRGQLQVGFDPARVAGGSADVPQIYEVEVRFEDAEPPLRDVQSTGFLHAGWNERDVEGGYRFFTTDRPVPADGTWVRWQIQFDTTLEGGPGPKPQRLGVRLYDREGSLLGTKDATIK